MFETIRFHSRATPPGRFDDDVLTVRFALQRVPVVDDDRFERVVWVDRAAVMQTFGDDLLLPHDAETESYVFAKALWRRIGGDAESALAYLRERVDDAACQLTFGLGVVESRHAPSYEEAGRALVRAASRLQGDPNIGRLELALYDLVHGTDRLAFLLAHLPTVHCDEPTRHLETLIGGNMYLCCPSWLPRSVGNLFVPRADPVAAFQGPVAEGVRQSVRDGNYRYCNWRACPKMERLAPRPEVAPPPPSLPAEVFLAHDPTCNLSCPTCRTRVVAYGAQERAWLDRIVIGRLRPLIERAELVKVTGSGDPFASRHFRNVLAAFADVGRRQVHLHTNALLFDTTAFDALKLKGRLAVVEVSIDAAMEDTYRVVRRGGSFSQLLERLAFVAHLRRSGEIPFLQFDFVVQVLNYREMPAFVELAHRYAADRVFFSAVRNWGSFTDARFAETDVCASAHPEHRELRAVLRDPSLQDPIVDLGSVRHALPAN